MINLLPNEEKVQIRAARTNVILSRYIFIILFAIAFLVLVTGASYYVLRQFDMSAKQTISSHSLTSHSASSTPVANTQILLTQAQAILGSNISYVTTLGHITDLLPAHTVLKTISLSTTSFSEPFSFTALATTPTTATQIISSFKASPYFTNVTGTTPTSSGKSDYPYTVTITATMNRSIGR